MNKPLKLNSKDKEIVTTAYKKDEKTLSMFKGLYDFAVTDDVSNLKNPLSPSMVFLDSDGIYHLADTVRHTLKQFQ